MGCKVLNKVCERGTIGQNEGGTFFAKKMVHKRVRGWPSGRSLPYKNWLSTPPWEFYCGLFLGQGNSKWSTVKMIITGGEYNFMTKITAISKPNNMKSSERYLQFFLLPFPNFLLLKFLGFSFYLLVDILHQPLPCNHEIPNRHACRKRENFRFQYTACY